jgi:cobaltochelatase CobS
MSKAEEVLSMAKAVRSGTTAPKKEPKVEKVEVPIVVDPLFYLKPAYYSEVEDALNRYETIFLHGLPGCGKSNVLRYIAGEKAWKYIRVNLIRDMSKEDIYGYWEFKDGHTSFVDSAIVRSIKEGYFLILEELDIAPSMLLKSLNTFLEPSKHGRFTPFINLQTGDEIVPNAEFRFAATANTGGKGDETGLFPDSSTLDDAFLDRFDDVLKVGYPTIGQEIEILRTTTGCDTKTAEAIAKFADGVRNAFVEQKVYSTFSLRKSANLARKLVRGKKLSSALKYTVLDRCSIEDAKSIMEIANRIFGAKADT